MLLTLLLTDFSHHVLVKQVQTLLETGEWASTLSH